MSGKCAVQHTQTPSRTSLRSYTTKSRPSRMHQLTWSGIWSKRAGWLALTEMESTCSLQDRLVEATPPGLLALLTLSRVLLTSFLYVPGAVPISSEVWSREALSTAGQPRSDIDSETHNTTVLCTSDNAVLCTISAGIQLGCWHPVQPVVGYMKTKFTRWQWKWYLYTVLNRSRVDILLVHIRHYRSTQHSAVSSILKVWEGQGHLAPHCTTCYCCNEQDDEALSKGRPPIDK